MRKPEEGAAQAALDTLERIEDRRKVAAEWQLHHVRFFAFNDDERIKAARLMKEFQSLLKANGLQCEATSYPVSGHRRKDFGRT